MASSTILTMLERKPRYTIRDGQTAIVVLDRVSQSDHSPVRATLIDLSESGAKLSTSTCFPIGEAVELKLSVEQLDFEFLGTAEICWTRPGKGEDWLVACSFRPQIPKHILDTLVTCGLLQQRESERRYVSLPVTIRWELGEGTESVTLQDYSDGGFCIVTREPVETGRRLSMECEASNGEPLEVRAKVQWTFRTPKLHLAGCSIVNEQDFGCLRSLEG